ncbi:uncharacterized protein EI90DRAFT_3145503 [Cantharellus anzutake]|uniref:uncharacterized protein n=1 Tax=Cantharellus anzutake TaxID=1750568 RepID=UPI0019063C32|nr:uncharacterized protein EI90DRAFT_3145503 [Cantharellus anzutake]KAF8331907.1 hypothetical protein EI90DRAFT_3145503 [Cantharellus anzutake]
MLHIWARRSELVHILLKALREHGFFYVINHGISPETIQSQFDLAQATFDSVPQEEKKKYEAQPAETGSFRGYKIKDAGLNQAEWYNLDLHDIYPPESHPSILRPHLKEVEEFLKTVHHTVLKRVTALISLALELPEQFLWTQFDREAEPERDCLKYTMYHPMTSAVSKSCDGIFLQGHTDTNHITTLFSQPIAGLQVLMPDKRWKWVKHRDNAIIMNVGDQLAFQSGGIFRAAMHRVVQPPEDQVHQRRLGLFHFSRAFPGISLQPIKESPLVQREGNLIFPSEQEAPTTDGWEAARLRSYGRVELIRGEEYDVSFVDGIEVRWYN